MNPSGQGAAAPLLSALRLIRERWWIVLLVPVITTVLALAFALTATKKYDATSKLLFRESSLGSALVGVPEITQSDPQRTSATNLDLVTSNAVARRVKAQLRSPDSPEDLLALVKVTTEPDSDLVDITASDPVPRRAADVANAFAFQFVTFRREADQRTIAQGEALLRKRLGELPATATAERAQLSSALQKVIAVEAVQTGNAEVIDTAEVPTAASTPKPKLDAVVGLVIGLALGLAIAFLVDLLDRRVKAPEEFEALYGLRSLTTIPERGRSPSTQAERAQALEPFRILRNGLSFLSPSSPIKVVLVTSAVPGEGKSTVSAGLARAVALSGRTCVLVEADLRRPTFAQQFDLGDDQRGLTTALVGGALPESLLREAVPGLRSLRILPSGPLPPNSAELLRSDEMGSVLERLSQQADLVILDAPPLLPVADAQVLLDHPQVDACLVVARVYKTTREEARRTRAVIERLRRHNMGLVVNGIRELDAGYDPYGPDEGHPATTSGASPGVSRLRG